MQTIQLSGEFFGNIDQFLTNLHYRIISEYTCHHDDESMIAIKTYQMPCPYGRNTDEAFRKSQEAYKEAKHQIINYLNNHLDLDLDLEGYHYIIYSELESLELHFNDDTFTWMYHFTGEV